MKFIGSSQTRVRIALRRLACCSSWEELVWGFPACSGRLGPIHAPSFWSGFCCNVAAGWMNISSRSALATRRPPRTYFGNRWQSQFGDELHNGWGAGPKPQTWPKENDSMRFWEAIISSTPAESVKGTKSLMIPITWEIWLKRNNRIFRTKISSVNDIMQSIHQSLDSWRLVGSICAQHPFGDPPWYITHATLSFSFSLFSLGFSRFSSLIAPCDDVNTATYLS